jgi:hypothetical protein
MGIFGPDAPPSLTAATRRGPRSCEQLSDRYTLAHADSRFPGLSARPRQSIDYTSLTNIASHTGNLFWKDLELHHPGIDSLRLEADVAGGARSPASKSASRQQGRNWARCTSSRSATARPFSGCRTSVPPRGVSQPGRRVGGRARHRVCCGGGCRARTTSSDDPLRVGGRLQSRRRQAASAVSPASSLAGVSPPHSRWAAVARAAGNGPPRRPSCSSS